MLIPQIQSNVEKRLVDRIQASNLEGGQIIDDQRPNIVWKLCHQGAFLRRRRNVLLRMRQEMA